METKTPILSIGVVADILDVHQRTLRIYDDEGLLVPGRSEKNRRLYSFDDVEKGKFIQFMTRSLGVNLVSVKIILYLFRESKIAESEYLDKAREIAGDIGYDDHCQKEIKGKMSKKGRHKKFSRTDDEKSAIIPAPL